MPSFALAELKLRADLTYMAMNNLALAVIQYKITKAVENKPAASKNLALAGQARRQCDLCFAHLLEIIELFPAEKQQQLRVSFQQMYRQYEIQVEQWLDDIA